MKSRGQPWCISPRNKANGIFYYQLKDKETGKYMSATSTGTKDRNEALLIAYRRAMEFDSGIASEYTEWVKNVSRISLPNEQRPFDIEIAALVHAACQDAVAKMLGYEERWYPRTKRQAI